MNKLHYTMLFLFFSLCLNQVVWAESADSVETQESSQIAKQQDTKEKEKKKEKEKVPEFPILDLSIDENKATIFVIRNYRFAGGAISLDNYVNDLFIGRTPSGYFIKASIKPGEHDLWVVTQRLRNRSYFKIHLEKGKKYFVELEPKMKSGALAPIIKYLDEAEAIKLMKSIEKQRREDAEDEEF